MVPPARHRVLLADDYAEIVTAVGRLLAQDCEVVGSVADGAALLEAARQLRPDVIVVDLNMPKVNGLEACRRIRQSHPEIRVIVLTAANDDTIRQAALAAGAAAFVVKQSICRDLLPTINQVCGDRALKRQSPAIRADPKRVL